MVTVDSILVFSRFVVPGGGGGIYLWVGCDLSVLGSLRQVLKGENFCNKIKAYESDYFTQEEEEPIYYILEKTLTK